MCETLSETRHRSRKERPCIWCREKIAAGEMYVRSAVIVEGEFQANAYHPECLEALNDMAAEEGGCVLFESHSFKRGSQEES